MNLLGSFGDNRAIAMTCCAI